MCTYVKYNDSGKVFRPAETDLRCLKLVEFVENKDPNLKPLGCTPYRLAPLPDDILEGKRPLEAVGPKYVVRLWEGARSNNRVAVVKEGYIHSYCPELTEKELIMDIGDVVYLAGGTEQGFTESEANAVGCVVAPKIIGFVLYQCIIPKGTMYAEGTSSTTELGLACYVSEKIVFEKIVKNYIDLTNMIRTYNH